MEGFQGMRWFKTDFQVQTPEDAAHWADAETRLPEPRRPLVSSEAGPKRPDERPIQIIAQTFLRRCHELELEVIGITDHNFSQKIERRDWFLTHLIEQNKTIAREVGRQPIHIFPGFEIDIGYHVLCLFEPVTNASRLGRINSILCKLGLDESERFVGSSPAPLRRLGADVSLKTVIDLVQGEHNGLVIAAHSDQNDGILSNARHIGDFQSSKLLAIEITATPPSQRVSEILKGRNRDWSRQGNQPAAVMSSDAKSLKADAFGSPGPNSLGYRHTWVKMSKPSIEALRQAFLDSESRIRLLGSRPSDQMNHPRITRVSVKGAPFLADMDVHFSESLNCVIGGRGSGKSSLLEYIRFALVEESADPIGGDEDKAIARKRMQLLRSLPPTAEIRVTFEVGHGVADTLIYRPGRTDGPKRWLEGRDVGDLTTVLRQIRAQFFSQGELSRMTSGENGQAQVLALIDTAAGSFLGDLKAQEAALRSRLKGLFHASRDALRLQSEAAEAEQEAVELERQLSARAEVQNDAQQSRYAAEAKRYISMLAASQAPIIEALESLLANIVSPQTLLPTSSLNWPRIDWFNHAVSEIEKARTGLSTVLASGLAQFTEALENQLGTVATQPVLDAIEDTQKQFRDACKERGLQEGDITHMQELQDLRQSKLGVVEDRHRRLGVIQAEADMLPDALKELHDVWRHQFSVRQTISAEIEASIASGTVQIKTTYSTDEASFRTLWNRLAPPDRRGRLARRWDDLGTALHSAWSSSAAPSPWELLVEAQTDLSAIPNFGDDGLEDLIPALFSHIDSAEVLPTWEDVRISRVSDGIDVELLREDKSLAGSMRSELSEGQRNTVLLNLMLARGDGPIVIDQPEDELDSSFIYRNLVRDLRSMKLKRQLIIATHNANLPVNADAELIHALEARDGKGKVLVGGGLDRKKVAQAVLDVMEGSEQAFRRRSDKYHF